ncbi:MAG TPA: hypothetical protein VLA58_00135 [Chitinophagaceae bacterium]|nr:hypothetical protein [Chitinophagaceae bacterium]
MSRKIAVFLSVIVLSVSGLHAQTVNAKQVYLELFGAGGGISLNFDSRFGQKENGLGYRVGIGGEYSFSSALGSSKAVSIPVGLNYLFGAKKHYFELGGGATPFFGDKTYYPQSYWGANFNAGYRLTPFNKKGFSFRAGYMQWIMFYPNDTEFSPFLYLSFGYRF